MSLVNRSILLVCLLSSSFVPGLSQTLNFSGHVTDPTGLNISQATVQLFSRDTGAAYSTVTNSAGDFLLILPVGAYLLQVRSPGLELPGSPRIINLPEDSRTALQLAVPNVATSVLVTAAGTPQSLDETTKAVSVVNRDEIDRRGLEATIDALREIPGLRVSQRGGPGAFATVQARGLRTFDTSILVDGVRFRDVGATQADASSFLSDLLVVDQSRIEVLRGSGSSLYGTNAIGGVINIITDIASGPFHGSITASGGGLGEVRGLARFGGAAYRDRFHFSAGFGHQDVTRGVADHGRYRNTSGNGLVDYQFRPGLIVSGRLLASDVFGQLSNIPSGLSLDALPLGNRVRAIGLNQDALKLAEAGQPFSSGPATFVPELADRDYSRTAQFISSLVALQHQVSAPLSYRLSYQSLLSNRDVVNGPAGAGFYQPQYRTSDQFNGRIDTLAGRATYLVNAHNLVTGGYEWEREYFDSPSSDRNPDLSQRVNSRSQASETSHSLDVQDQIRLAHDRLQISLSGRYQNFNLAPPIFSGNVPVYASAPSLSPPSAYTGDLSIAYFLRSTGTKIRSHAGNSYRKPSLYELFGTSFFGSFFSAYGDPRLKPERSVAIDGGIDQYFASERVRLSASYFYTRLQQVIGFDFSGRINAATDPFGRSLGYFNTGGGFARGVEISAEAKPLRSTRIQASYTYTDARDRTSQYADGTLQTPRINPHSFHVVLLQQFGSHFDAALDLTASSDYLFPFNSLTYVFPGQRQAGISAGYTHLFTDRLKARFYTRISNLSGQTYYEDGFQTPGRWAVVGTTFSF